MAFCQGEIMHKSFAGGEKGAHPQHREGLGAGAAVLLCRAQEAWKVLQLGWAGLG